MTFIYWGAVDTGKNHLQQYAIANRKSFITWHKTSAKKYSYTKEKQIREYYYTDEVKRIEEERKKKLWGDDEFNEEKEIHSEESADSPEVSKTDLN